MNLYPFFAKVLPWKMKTRGKYSHGFPRGAVVHYTAGADGAVNTMKDGQKRGFAYWCIQRDGQLFCAHPVNEWGYHAGESRWTKFAKRLVGAVSDDLIGIELNAAGTVKPSGAYFKTYFGQILDAKDVRYSAGKANQAKGFYHKYTPQQESTLIETLLWLKEQAPTVFDFDLVLGHDEVSGPLGLGYWRKTDPGAALSMTMPELRELLKKKWLERQRVVVS